MCPNQVKEKIVKKSVTNDDGCWVWTGSKLNSGYGQLRFKTKNKQERLSHRVSWVVFNGYDVPNDLQVLHWCDVKLCVNPDHLFLGTQLDNIRDCIAKGRNKPPIKSWNSKLDPNKAKEIRKMYADGNITTRALGKIFGVGGSVISRIILNKTWIDKNAAII